MYATTPDILELFVEAARSSSVEDSYRDFNISQPRDRRLGFNRAVPAKPKWPVEVRQAILASTKTTRALAAEYGTSVDMITRLRAMERKRARGR